MEGCGLPLGDLLHLAEKLGGRRLIHSGFLGQSQNPAGFQNPQNPQGIHITRILRHIKGNLHMALGRQVVNLIGLHLANDANQAGRIRQIPVVELDFAHEMVDSCGIGDGGPAGNAVDFIALFQKKLRKIRPILTGNAGNQRNF